MMIMRRIRGADPLSIGFDSSRELSSERERVREKE